MYRLAEPATLCFVVSLLFCPLISSTPSATFKFYENVRVRPAETTRSLSNAPRGERRTPPSGESFLASPAMKEPYRIRRRDEVFTACPGTPLIERASARPAMGFGFGQRSPSRGARSGEGETPTQRRAAPVSSTRDGSNSRKIGRHVEEQQIGQPGRRGNRRRRRDRARDRRALCRGRRPRGARGHRRGGARAGRRRNS